MLFHSTVSSFFFLPAEVCLPDLRGVFWPLQHSVHVLSCLRGVVDLASLQLGFQIHSIEEGRVHLGHLQNTHGFWATIPLVLAEHQYVMKRVKKCTRNLAKQKTAVETCWLFFFLLEFGPGVFVKRPPWGRLLTFSCDAVVLNQNPRSLTQQRWSC